MNKNIWFGMLAALTALVALTLPAKADPIFVRTTGNAQNITTSGTWTPVDETIISINIPAGQRRLVTARFTAESSCISGSGIQGTCAVRIVAVKGANVTELNPKVGTDFAFDSSDNGTESFGSWESHGVNRSAILSSGNYLVFVQGQLVNGATNLSLDDRQLEVELTTP